MNRPLPTRLLLVLLAGLLQVALLPGQVRLPCMLRTASLSGCCCIAVEEPLLVSTCCGQAAQPEPVDELSSIGGSCSCGLEAEELLATPKLAGLGSSGEGQPDVDDTPAAVLPRSLRDVRFVAVARSIALRAAPRARTGPPLYVLLQVFLI